MKLSDIKAGDILFYTERPYGPDSDAAVEIIEFGGELYPKTLCVRQFGGFVNTENDEIHWGFPLNTVAFKENEWHKFTHFDRENMVKFMEGNFLGEISKTSALNRESIIQLLEADITFHRSFMMLSQDKLKNFLNK